MVVCFSIAFCPFGRVSHCSINTFSPENAVSTFFLNSTIPLNLINVADAADVFSSSRVVLNIIKQWMQGSKTSGIYCIFIFQRLCLCFISRTVKWVHITCNKTNANPHHGERIPINNLYVSIIRLSRAFWLHARTFNNLPAFQLINHNIVPPTVFSHKM